MATRRLTDIRGKSIVRMSCGIGELDKIIGHTVHEGVKFFGFPIGKITYLSGDPGVGKSRLCIQICKNLNDSGQVVLYFQGEVPLDQFSEWFGSATHPDKVICGDDTDPSSIIEEIRNNSPVFVVVDSANMIDGFMNISGSHNEFFSGLREVLDEVGAHCLMLGHNNKDGSTKGPSHVPHMVDINCRLVLLENALWIRKMGWSKALRDSKVAGDNSTYGKCIVWEVGKNRYGFSDGWVRFYHNDIGVQYLDSIFVLESRLRECRDRVVIQEEVAPSVGIFDKINRIGSWFQR